MGFPPRDRGNGVVMRHRVKTVSFSSTLESWCGMFEAPLLFGMYKEVVGSLGSDESDIPGWDIYFQNDIENSQYLYNELLWACGRRESDAADGCKFKTLTEFQNALTSNYPEVQSEFYRALTANEKDKLLEYQALKSLVCYSLNQDPGFGATMSTWSTLHTVIKNAGVIWFPSLLAGIPDLSLFHKLFRLYSCIHCTEFIKSLWQGQKVLPWSDWMGFVGFRWMDVDVNVYNGCCINMKLWNKHEHDSGVWLNMIQ